MTSRKFTLLPLAGLALVMLQVGTVTEALAAACPAVTVAKDMGNNGDSNISTPSSSSWRSSKN